MKGLKTSEIHASTQMSNGRTIAVFVCVPSCRSCILLYTFLQKSLRVLLVTKRPEKADVVATAEGGHTLQGRLVNINVLGGTCCSFSTLCGVLAKATWSKLRFRPCPV